MLWIGPGSLTFSLSGVAGVAVMLTVRVVPVGISLSPQHISRLVHKLLWLVLVALAQ